MSIEVRTLKVKVLETLILYSNKVLKLNNNKKKLRFEKERGYSGIFVTTAAEGGLRL